MSEQTTLDEFEEEFEENLEELIDRLSELVTTPEPTEALAPSLTKDSSKASRGLMNVRKRLDFSGKEHRQDSYIG